MASVTVTLVGTRGQSRPCHLDWPRYRLQAGSVSGTGTDWDGLGGEWGALGLDWEGLGLDWEGLGGTGMGMRGTGIGLGGTGIGGAMGSHGVP